MGLGGEGNLGRGRSSMRRCYLRILRKCGRGLGKGVRWAWGGIISGSGTGVHIGLHGNSQGWMWRAAWTQLVWLDKELEEHRGVRPVLRWGWWVDIAGQRRTWGLPIGNGKLMKHFHQGNGTVNHDFLNALWHWSGEWKRGSLDSGWPVRKPCSPPVSKWWLVMNMEEGEAGLLEEILENHWNVPTPTSGQGRDSLFLPTCHHRLRYCVWKDSSDALLIPKKVTISELSAWRRNEKGTSSTWEGRVFKVVKWILNTQEGIWKSLMTLFSPLFHLSNRPHPETKARWLCRSSLWRYFQPSPLEKPAFCWSKVQGVGVHSRFLPGCVCMCMCVHVCACVCENMPTHPHTYRFNSLYRTWE